jgi:hypothetical protein
VRTRAEWQAEVAARRERVAITRFPFIREIVSRALEGLLAAGPPEEEHTMAKKQSRRSISVRGTTYAHLRPLVFGRSESLSDFIEQAIVERCAKLGLKPPPPALPSSPKPAPRAPRLAVAASEPKASPPVQPHPSVDDSGEAPASTTRPAPAVAPPRPPPTSRSKAVRPSLEIPAGVDDPARSGRRAAAPASDLPKPDTRGPRNVVAF